MLDRTRSVLARLALALALLIPSTVAVTAVTAAPAVADDHQVWYCYEFDNEVSSSEVYWYSWDYGERYVTYDHYSECFDGHTYWWHWMYRWSQWEAVWVA